ncbi:MAG: glycosyltransferase [Rhodoferax sp.]
MNTVVPVSVVVPCYRCKTTIERAVASVVAQTHRPAQLILVDDASGDGTAALLDAMQKRLGDWVEVLALAENGGAAQARNAGWERATQAYVAFLDADDAWHPCKIEVQYGYMSQHPRVALSGHLHRELPSHDGQLPNWALTAHWDVQPVTWRVLLLRHQFVTPSVMLRRDLPVRFARNLRYMEDYRLWLDIAEVPHEMVKLNVELAAIYKAAYGATGLSGNLWQMERGELAVLRHFRQTGRLSSALWMLVSAYSLVKYLRRRLIVWLR